MDDDDDDFDDDDEIGDYDDSDEPYSGSVLKAMVVQVRICENHQNGKDTHLRAVQLFARDDMNQARRGESTLSKTPKKQHAASTKKKAPLAHKLSNNIKVASWMLEPDMR